MLRCDQGSLEKFETMPNGMIRLWGSLANVGWLKYYTPDGAERLEYVDEETLFDPVHLDSVGGNILTLHHPPEMITPSLYKKYAVGSTGTQVFKNDARKTIDIVTIVGDEEAISSIRDGKTTDLSMGYTCETIPIGENKYKQTNRICNHNALVEKGRAEMAKLHIDGVDYIVPTTYLGERLDNETVPIKKQKGRVLTFSLL